MNSKAKTFLLILTQRNFGKLNLYEDFNKVASVRKLNKKLLMNISLNVMQKIKGKTFTRILKIKFKRF